MRELNAAVDLERRTPEEVVRQWRLEKGLGRPGAERVR
jgi:glycine betaine/choline ABC-type transport system substrate-binding protein